MKLKPPVFWFGGKFYLVPKILPLIPPHKVYVEPFGGAAHLLFAKPPSPVEIYNDIDPRIVTFYRILQDPQGVGKLLRIILFMPLSREEYLQSKERVGQAEGFGSPEWAARYMVKQCQGFSGHFDGGWRFQKLPYKESRHFWFAHLERLMAASRRLQSVIIENKDFREILQAYDSPETFFYCDPPYVPETRSSSGPAYLYDMSLQDHEELVALLLQVKGTVILSGYAHPVYAPLEQAGWLRISFPQPRYGIRSALGTHKPVCQECLWLNFPSAILQNFP